MMIFFGQSASGALENGQGDPALFLLLLIVVFLGWFGVRAGIRRLQASRAKAVVHDAFQEFALVALVNAAQLDGRISDPERTAIAEAMRELAGPDFDVARIATPARSGLSKDELVAYLEEKSRALPNQQKVAFLKALLGVLVADGRFDEAEHQALVDYTAAVGFDRQGAPGMLRGLLGDMARDRIT